MDRPRLRRLLLGLLAETPPPEAPYRGLSAREWLELDRIAGLHGLRPVLQFKSDALDWRDTIPPAIRQRWQHGQRAAAMQALVQRRDLLEIREILARAGIMRPVALKGAFLAWHAYAQPALRPMGDLDLLIEVEQALSAFEALNPPDTRK